MILHNTLTGKKENFKPFRDKKVNLFVCGPTVYNYSHLGHARTYIFFDIFVKYLKQAGFNVFYLQNITDIDDKIINLAKEEKRGAKNLADFFKKEYFKDMKSLGVDAVSKYACATDYIKEIISQTERLLERGIAYQIEDGIYYDISKFKDYGKLSKRTVGQAEDGVSRIDDGKGKRNKGDFCLWKFIHRDSLNRSECGEFEPSWKSPFGLGRPGWHIEDTAITEKHFGAQYDIHGGARDLIFPHHEAEIAQMEAISGQKPLVRYWLHSGFLTVSGAKMSKSLKNFIAIREFLKNYSAKVLRLFILKSHYRSPIDYNEKSIKQAEKELGKIEEFVIGLKSQISTLSAIGRTAEKAITQNSKLRLTAKAEKNFQKVMDDDLNTPRALAAIFDLIKKANQLIGQEKLDYRQAKDIYGLLLRFDQVLGLGLDKVKKKKAVIPKEIKELVKKREKARQNKDWKMSDKLRGEIESNGYKVEDGVKGVNIIRLSHSRK